MKGRLKETKKIIYKELHLERKIKCNLQLYLKRTGKGKDYLKYLLKHRLNKIKNKKGN